MSAECSDCGRDIEYPAGSWPLGECSYCLMADERDGYEAALREIARREYIGETTGGLEVTSGVHGREQANEIAREALAARSPSRTERGEG